MYDYKFTAENGVVSFVRAKDRSSAIKTFCEAEGCSVEYAKTHFKIQRMKQEKRYVK